MTLAQSIAKARAEGEAIGEAQGALKLIQELLGLPVPTDADLADLSLAEMESRLVGLIQRHQTEFKRP
jgi:hypothetical protein